MRDGKAEFVPVKTGIAGDKYFEVLSGLKDGDSVIVGPFASVRTLADGAAVKVEQPPRATARQRNELVPRSRRRSRFSAIWANKLRSFLTVLGNIVAVTSIIAVVSLIQGMNAYVSRRHRLRRRRRQLHDPAHAGRADAKPTRNGCGTIRASRSTTARPSGAFSENIGAVAAQAQLERAASATATRRSTASRSRACRATTSTSRRSTSSAAG